MPPKLETESLTRVVDGERIVDSVSVRIPAAEVAAVIGPSGAGKSSFLRLLNRLDEPTEGTVYLDGRDYREIDPLTLRRRVGFVPQAPALQSGTVVENVTIGDRLCDEPVDDERVARLLERVGLGGYRDEPIDDLSGGEQQRVAITRTLYVDPEVVLLDEPSAHLDSATESQIEGLLEELIREDELTCVVVTHDTDQARRLGDRIVRFEDGRVTQVGAPREVIP
ncbi:ABC transporter ATP-binding protein [Natronorubrum texcoconense]|uniref:Putative ABC transport system ATP-binding protein n=1 Tax=Natronorubrum texcoconense TaxID=1095776 RepID=A0A1G9ALT5_9EURY|nr:ATP-binding cassette domain-containing protein [Natronorubrum texcoconense]SDK27540.1 putative ABC transport system ATP-binding protein [Natronorubrum texcoconense]